MVKTRVLVLIVAIVLIVAVALTAVFLHDGAAGGWVAVVTVDGKTVYEADLSQVEEPYEKEIVTPYGKNVLLFEKNNVRIVDADCDNKECVHSGYARPSRPIVCLPHRLVVKIQKEGDADAVSE